MKPNTDPFITYGISVVCCGLVTIASTFVKHQALYFCFAVTLGTVSGQNIHFSFDVLQGTYVIVSIVQSKVIKYIFVTHPHSCDIYIYKLNF